MLHQEPYVVCAERTRDRQSKSTFGVDLSNDLEWSRQGIGIACAQGVLHQGGEAVEIEIIERITTEREGIRTARRAARFDAASPRQRIVEASVRACQNKGVPTVFGGRRPRRGRSVFELENVSSHCVRETDAVPRVVRPAAEEY